MYHNHLKHIKGSNSFYILCTHKAQKPAITETIPSITVPPISEWVSVPRAYIVHTHLPFSVSYCHTPLPNSSQLECCSRALAHTELWSHGKKGNQGSSRCTPKVAAQYPSWPRKGGEDENEQRKKERWRSSSYLTWGVQERARHWVCCTSLLVHVIIISVFLEVSLLVGQYFRLRVSGWLCIVNNVAFVY